MVINTNIEEMQIGTHDNGEPFKVYIVDDSAFMVKTIKKMIEGFGCSVVGSASNGEEAIDQLAEMGSEVDMVTLDISMPKKDGLTTLPEVLKMHPNLKVIMISALGDKEKVKQAIMNGAKHFIVKPFKREKVFDILKWVVERP